MSHYYNHRSRRPDGFAPDLLTPSQFFPGMARRYESGERRLMAALLEDTYQIYCRHAATGRSARPFQEAQTWVDSDDETWPFSFERVCEALHLDAQYVRARLRKASEQAPQPLLAPAPRLGSRHWRPGSERHAGTMRAARRVGVVTLGVLTTAMAALKERR